MTDSTNDQVLTLRSRNTKQRSLLCDYDVVWRDLYFYWMPQKPHLHEGEDGWPYTDTQFKHFYVRCLDITQKCRASGCFTISEEATNAPCFALDFFKRLKNKVAELEHRIIVYPHDGVWDIDNPYHDFEMQRLANLYTFLRAKLRATYSKSDYPPDTMLYLGFGPGGKYRKDWKSKAYSRTPSVDS